MSTLRYGRRLTTLAPTPINDSLLFNDLEQILITKDELALETSDIEAEQRLANPEGIYYKRKETTN